MTPNPSETPREIAERIVNAFIAKQDTVNPDGSSCEDYDRDLIEPIERELTLSAGKWISTSERLPDEQEKVDVWLHIYASPRSMGMSDSFRVIEAWRVGGKWFHHHKEKHTELFSDYVTHWQPLPPAPSDHPRGEG